MALTFKQSKSYIPFIHKLIIFMLVGDHCNLSTTLVPVGIVSPERKCELRQVNGVKEISLLGKNKSMTTMFFCEVFFRPCIFSKFY
jgi:hypothetical protein